MHKVFISGSMSIKSLDENVQARINNIVDSGYQVIVGDASGVDSSIQEYLISKSMRFVVVYCSGDSPRNNLGHWPVSKIESDAPSGTRAFFTAKDLKMAEDCDYGLMVWDTKSTGTLSNAIELLKRNKTALIYVNKAKEFIKIKEVTDIEKLTTYMSLSALEKANKKLKIREVIEYLKHQQDSLF